MGLLPLQSSAGYDLVVGDRGVRTLATLDKSRSLRIIRGERCVGQLALHVAS